MHVFGLVTLDAGSTWQLASGDKSVLDKALINLVPKQVNNLHTLRQQTLVAPSSCGSRTLAPAYINPLPPTRKANNRRSSEALPYRYTLERSFHIRVKAVDFPGVPRSRQARRGARRHGFFVRLRRCRLITVSIYIFVTDASYTQLRSSRTPSTRVTGRRAAEEDKKIDSEGDSDGRDQRRRREQEVEGQGCWRRTRRRRCVDSPSRGQPGLRRSSPHQDAAPVIIKTPTPT
jgi:hypothetical protein